MERLATASCGWVASADAWRQAVCSGKGAGQHSVACCKSALCDTMYICDDEMVVAGLELKGVCD